MDKLSKRILTELNKPKDASTIMYNYDEDINALAESLSVDPETLHKAVHYLETEGYIQCNGPYNFSLDHKGLHWKEFRIKALLDYLKDNWIDFFAMTAAVASLILSIIALSK